MGAHGGGGAGSGAGRTPEDERLAALIVAGLTDQAQRPVDVGSLVEGARTGARRLRRRRNAARIAAAAVVVATAPVALSTLPLGRPEPSLTAVFSASASQGRAEQPSGVEGTAPAALAGAGDISAQPAPSGSTSSPAVSRSPLDVAGGTPVSGTGLSRDGTGRVLIPDGAVLQVSDVSVVRLQPGSDQDSADPVGPTANLVCAQGSAVVGEPAGVRQLDYRSDTTGDAWTLTTRVQVLAGGLAASELDWLRRSMGYCASALRLSRAAVAGVPGDGVVLGYQVGVGSRSHAVLVVGVVRQGRTTASVELVVPATAGSGDDARVGLALDQARQLLSVADRRLQSSGLVAGAAADPSLAS